VGVADEEGLEAPVVGPSLEGRVARAVAILGVVPEAARPAGWWKASGSRLLRWDCGVGAGGREVRGGRICGRAAGWAGGRVGGFLRRGFWRAGGRRRVRDFRGRGRSTQRCGRTEAGAGFPGAGAVYTALRADGGGRGVSRGGGGLHSALNC
jgi:hypothetical protein